MNSSCPQWVRILPGLFNFRNTKLRRTELVSWGGFKSSVYDEARRQFFDIRLWDASDLVEQLTEQYDKLPDDIQAELTLRRIWALVQDGVNQ